MTCYITVVTHTLVIRLICMHLFSGLQPLGLCIHIRKITHACVTAITCIHVYVMTKQGEDLPNLYFYTYKGYLYIYKSVSDNFQFTVLQLILYCKHALHFCFILNSKQLLSTINIFLMHFNLIIIQATQFYTSNDDSMLFINCHSVCKWQFLAKLFTYEILLLKASNIPIHYLNSLCRHIHGVACFAYQSFWTMNQDYRRHHKNIAMSNYPVIF